MYQGRAQTKLILVERGPRLVSTQVRGPLVLSCHWTGLLPACVCVLFANQRICKESLFGSEIIVVVGTHRFKSKVVRKGLLNSYCLHVLSRNLSPARPLAEFGDFSPLHTACWKLCRHGPPRVVRKGVFLSVSLCPRVPSSPSEGFW